MGWRLVVRLYYAVMRPLLAKEELREVLSIIGDL